jgi:hypothetical protein
MSDSRHKGSPGRATNDHGDRQDDSNGVIAASSDAAATVAPPLAQDHRDGVEAPTGQTLAVPAPGTDSNLRSGVVADFVGEQGEALLRRLRQLAREREASFLAVVIILGALAYLALDRSPPLWVSSIRADAPALMFDARVLTGSGARQRERDVQLVMGGGRITVTSGSRREQPLYAVGYDEVISVSSSRGRDPMWKSPKGPAPVVRFNGGALGSFGIFRDRQWIALETTAEDRFILLRVDEDVVKKVLAALEDRTGRTPQILEPR